MTNPRPIEPDVPIRLLDLMPDGCQDLPSCRKMAAGIARRLGGRFIGRDRPEEGQLVVAAIDTTEIDLDGLLARMRTVYKGNALREIRKCRELGYSTHRFQRADHVPDIHEINTSKEARSGGAMKESYLRSIEELGGFPKARAKVAPIECPMHHDTWWGIFQEEPGRRQGDITVDEKLIGYIDLRRVGDLAIYSLIIGHGDYLRQGVMQQLHIDVMEWVLESDSAEVKGIRHLMYAGWYQGGDGLRRWKKKMGFEPCYLVIDGAQRDRLLEEEPARSMIERIGRSTMARVPRSSRIWRRICGR